MSEEVWSLNLNRNDVDHFVKPTFWCDVLKAWSEYSFTDPRYINQIRSQRIWFNSHIRIGDKPIHNKVARANGFKLVSDIVSCDGSIIGCTQIRALSRNSISFMEYYGIYESVCVKWKQILKTTGQLGNPFANKLDIILSEDHVSQYVCNE